MYGQHLGEFFYGLDFKLLISKIEDNIAKTIIKDAKLSTEARKKGDALYEKGRHTFTDHDQIFRLYCESIALAPSGSKELALAYKQRSIFLFHIKRYKDCINDTDKVLNMVKLDVLKEKLNDQKKQCLLALESSAMSLESLNISKETIPDLGKAATNTNENYSLCSENAHKMKEDCDEITGIFESVDIRYSNAHGRHLVAKRDFNPGDIIFAETHYARIADPTKSHISCSNCLSMCWSGIPCEKCNWAMFCSKTCKDEATKKYHDIECPIITYMMKPTGILFKPYHLAVRSLITGLKDTGSLKELREDIESVDQCKDKCWQGFKNGESLYKSRFNSLYSLSIWQGDPVELLVMDQMFTEMTMIYLVKFTTIFGMEQKLESIQDLKNNPDIIFFCSLLTKLLKIRRVNNHSVKNTERIPCPYSCWYSMTRTSCMNNCCSRGLSLSPIASLINHSCNNNVSRCFSDDGKIIIYALQPIKQNSEIFDCYARDFSEYSKRERLEVLDAFECDCLACKYDWPPLLDEYSQVPRNYSMKPSESKIYKDCKHFFKAVNSGQCVVSVDKAVGALSNSLIKAFKVLPEPALTTCKLIKALEYFFQKKYGYKAVEYGSCSQ